MFFGQVWSSEGASLLCNMLMMLVAMVVRVPRPIRSYQKLRRVRTYNVVLNIVLRAHRTARAGTRTDLERDVRTDPKVIFFGMYLLCVNR